MPAPNAALHDEWLETDGLGGFASGTAAGIRTRRYHALLLTATSPPTGRVVLVNGLEAWMVTPHGRQALTSQCYAPEIIHPDGCSRIIDFHYDPWPTWTFRLDDGAIITQELFICPGRCETIIRWSVKNGRSPMTLEVRPLLSGRDYHALHLENAAFRFDAHVHDGTVVWQPYDGLPAIAVLTNATYRHAPDWYRRFAYIEERRRGFNHLEDLASPGVLSFDLANQDAIMVLHATTDRRTPPEWQAGPIEYTTRIREQESHRRRQLGSIPDRSAEAYIVRRGSGRTIVAGYPWFTDWGRDTFIAMRGLCLSRGRLDIARDILVEWAGAVSEGMLPNRFPDAGETPEYNSVDASLWYVVAVHDYLQRANAARVRVSKTVRTKLEGAVEAILRGHAAGTRFGIHMDTDGLLAAGVPGVQLTWMDAKVGDWVVTPRIGKPVEVQALWINALQIGASFNPKWEDRRRKALAAFNERFWNAEGGCLFDVIDVNHISGYADTSFRPNQILAVGGLPFQLLDERRSQSVVESVESRLLTTLGLRSLAPGERRYQPRYEGDAAQRDAAYHQGTVWAWLLGPFVEAWLRVRGDNQRARVEARRRFLQPLLDHLGTAGLGHVSEIADGDGPHTPRGCPFQAWSLGELLRIRELVEG
ncbi:MAG: glycogen debranching protein [Phycisphaerales bacterium]|nr:glycogen debranching protein [Phycisphaerales bacterium]